MTLSDFMKYLTSASARHTLTIREGSLTLCETPRIMCNISVAHCMPLSTRLKGLRMITPPGLQI